MGSSIHLSGWSGQSLKRGLAVLVAILALTLGVALSAPVGAQGVYGGGASYGNQAYGQGANGSTNEPSGPSGVGVPNTGFAPLQQLQRAADEQPFLFWGSVAAVITAITLAAFTTVRIIKRKQEN